ncbi:hypothetical protein BV22DRAFT_1032427 [Leucogyrophana mollusca]|uniref:Uncharacterized protein n=1 Tax=Leucogyrophana mollusca TaxID=85980 RepID=A0ACB8BLS4_9AGAM|nr:hypothetical protein BV22DRAFT_1032427 [Leucogyrophana mollusca]
MSDSEQISPEDLRLAQSGSQDRITAHFQDDKHGDVLNYQDVYIRPPSLLSSPPPLITMIPIAPPSKVQETRICPSSPHPDASAALRVLVCAS